MIALIANLIFASAVRADMLVPANEILNWFTPPANIAESRAVEEKILGEATKHSEWLWQVGPIYRSEVRSIRVVSKEIFENYGLRTVIVSNWQQIDVPGFDGVLMDPATETIVANFSLKEVTGSARALNRRVRVANSALTSFSNPENWAYVFLDNLMGARLRFSWQKDNFNFSEAQRNLFTQRRDVLVPLSRFYGVGTGRPQWLLTHVTDKSPVSADDIEQTLSRLKAPDLAKAIFVVNDKLVPINPCQIELKTLLLGL